MCLMQKDGHTTCTCTVSYGCSSIYHTTGIYHTTMLWGLGKTRNLSAGHLRCDNVTLTFDLLTPKPNQFISVPRWTNDKSLTKIHQQVLEISQKHSLGCTDSWGSTMTATNHDDQLGEIYPTMLKLA